MKNMVFAITLSFLLGSVEASADTKKGVLKDPRDGKIYKTVQIGSQTWMAENLNYKIVDSFCYNNKTSNCAKYGRLYTWNAAMAACPSGWHLPAVSEFRTLFETVGGTEDNEKREKEMWTNVGKMLKSKSDWVDNGNGSDAFGFSALPSGFHYEDEFGSQGEMSPFWTSIGDDPDIAMSIVLFYQNDYGFIDSNTKLAAGAVRCVKD